MRRCEARAYQTRAYGINANSIGAELVSSGMQQAEQPSFTRVVCGQVWFAIVRIGRCGKHDGTFTAPLHALGCDLDGVEGTREIHREGPVPKLGCGAAERTC